MPHRLVVDSAEEGAEVSVTEEMLREGDEAEGRMRSAVAEILRNAQVCPGLSASRFFRNYISGGAVLDFSPHEVVAFMAYGWPALLRPDGESERQRLFEAATSAVNQYQARVEVVLFAMEGLDMTGAALRLRAFAALRASDG